jgi:hypothetical protein
MDRHLICECGGTAWISREDGMVLIECTNCGASASGETLGLARSDWNLENKRRQQAEATQKPPDHPGGLL